MIDSVEEYKKFLDDNRNENLFLHYISTHDTDHPVISTPSILFIYNFKTECLYHLGIDHQDIVYSFNIQQLINDINTFTGKLFVIDKKSFIQKFPIKNIFDINLGLHLQGNELINYNECETIAHKLLRHRCSLYKSNNKVIPLMKHREMICNISDEIYDIPNLSIFDDKCYKKINLEIIGVLSDIEKHGIFVDKNRFKEYFNVNVDGNYVYSQYNIYTSTGRPSNRFNGVNYAALSKENGCRECFISRFKKDGIMVLIDYSAFHPRIICELTNFKLSKDINFYDYIAKLCFGKNEIDQQDMIDAKQLTFRQLYGGVDEQYSHIRFFYNLKSYIEFHWEEYQTKGYATTPLFGRKIRNIENPSPSKLFNYILQSTETEIAVPILSKVNDFLYTKQSKTILYTYDSILLDVCRDELDEVIKNVTELMMDCNKFPVKCYTGQSYNNLNILTQT